MQDELAAFTASFQADGCAARSAAGAGMGEGRPGLAFGDTRPILDFLFFTARRKQDICPEARTGKERRAEQVLPGNLEQGDEFHVAQAQSAVTLGNLHRRPAEFRAQLGPQSLVPARGPSPWRYAPARNRSVLRGRRGRSRGVLPALR